MIHLMNQPWLRWIGRCTLLLALLAPATSAFARTEEIEREPIDARLEGYAESSTPGANRPLNVTLDTGSTAVTWILTIVLGVLTFGGLFKDAKRTHLD